MTDKAGRFASFFTGKSIAGWLAFVSIVAIFVITIMLNFVQIPIENRDMLFTGLGLMLGWGSTIINFYFGSSAGSKLKTEAMAAHMSAPKKPESKTIETPKAIIDHFESNQQEP